MATARKHDYADIDLGFYAHPVTHDIVKKMGPDAVARSIRYLVLTNYSERPFQTYLGSNVPRQLFENITPQTANIIKDGIVQVVRNFEPRATLLGVDVQGDADNNKYNIRIVFQVNNRPEPFQVQLFLERIR